MTKVMVVLISLVLLVLSLPLQACEQASGNNFDVLSLNVTSAKVLVNEKFTVTANISNASRNEVTYIVPVMVNGIADDRTTLTLAPGKSQEVQFTLQKTNPGNYEIGIGGKTAVVAVEELLPASFILANLHINPQEANPGEEVTMVALLTNTGGSPGTYNAELKVDDIVEQSQQVIMPAGANCNLVFKLTENESGTYNIAMGDLPGQFTVLEPVKVIQVTTPAPAAQDRISHWQKSSGGCCSGGTCP